MKYHVGKKKKKTTIVHGFRRNYIDITEQISIYKTPKLKYWKMQQSFVGTLFIHIWLYVCVCVCECMCMISDNFKFVLTWVQNYWNSVFSLHGDLKWNFKNNFERLNINVCNEKVKMRRASLVVQMVKNPPVMQETQVRFLGWENPPEKGMVTHSRILAWRIPWTEEIYLYIWLFPVIGKELNQWKR